MTEINLITPEKWVSRSFWAGRRRVYGIVIAFSPMIFALGIELIGGEGRKAKGAALLLGPCWLGFATLLREPAA